MLWAGCGNPARTPSSTDAPGNWAFEVTPTAGAQELNIQADLGPGSGELLNVDEGAEPFVQEVQIQSGTGWTPVPRRGAAWVASGCKAGCRLRYRYQLAQAAQRLDDIERAGLLHGALFAPPSTWLLRPEEQGTVGRWKLRVHASEDTPFHSGLMPSADGFEAATDDLPESPYSAFGHFAQQTLSFSDGALEMAVQKGTFDERERALIEAWVRRAGEAVHGYYKHFPIPRVLVFVLEGDRPGVGFGRTLGNGGASILISVGRPVKEEVLRPDWVLPHELIHLAFPSVPNHQSWIEEGLSTYIEPIARVHAGQLSEEDLWRDFVLSMPQGQPEPGDRGLDRTPTWGRLYWGGAIFCLLADVEIRKQSNGQRSLGDALRAINRAGGNVMHRWSLERALAIGDQATGTTVLRDLHRVHGSQPVRVDLAALWAALGLELRGHQLVRNEGAPLAPLRRQITEQP